MSYQHLLEETRAARLIYTNAKRDTAALRTGRHAEVQLTWLQFNDEERALFIEALELREARLAKEARAWEIALEGADIYIEQQLSDLKGA